MSQLASKGTFYSVLQCISALYQLGEITSETKNEMVALAQKGKEDRYDSLYLKCAELPDSDLVTTLKEMILFQV